MKVLYVNLGSRVIKEEETEPTLAGWGRSFIAQTLGGLAPDCDPLGPDNPLLLVTGPLAGFNLSSADRLSVGAKSPLTGGIKEANAGGTMARQLASRGYKALVIEGRAESGTYLLSIGEQARLLFRPDLAGKGPSQLAEQLQQEFGSDISLACVGPAGEMGFLSAGIAVTDTEGRPSRYAGRGGLGAVMGKKGLKAIVVEKGSGTKKIADEDTFRRLRKTWHELIVSNPVTGEDYPKYGTANMMKTVRWLGALPTRNFRQGDFAGADALSGEALRNLILARGGQGKTTHSCCVGCIVRCSNVFAGADGREVVSPLEYETIAMFGSNLEIDSLDWIARFNYICNDLGVDTIEVGGAVGVAMEGGLLSFGDAPAVEKALQEIGQGTLIGRLLGNGAEITGRVLGVERIPVVKGQCMPAYDPRALKGLGITFATTPMGADHTTGHTARVPLNHHLKEGQLEASRQAQVMQAAWDSLGLCLFTNPVLRNNEELVAGMLRSVLGLEVKASDFYALGEQVIGWERAFNARAGLGREKDQVPGFMHREKLPPYNLLFDFSNEELGRVFPGS